MVVVVGGGGEGEAGGGGGGAYIHGHALNKDDNSINSGGFTHGSMGSMEPPFLPYRMKIYIQADPL